MFDALFDEIFAREDLTLVGGPLSGEGIAPLPPALASIQELRPSLLASADVSVRALPPRVLLFNTGTPLDAQNDAFSILEDSQSVSGNLFTDNGSGADTIPNAATTSISQIGTLAVNGSTTTNLESGATVTVTPDGSFTFEPGAVYEYLSEGQTATEEIEYTLTDSAGAIDPGTFEAVIAAASLTGTNGQRLNGIDAAGYAGVAVSGVGDVNADGIDDVLVGSYLAGPNDEGAAILYFGDDDGLDDTNSVLIRGVGAEDLAGVSVSAAGDVNGDGIDDLIVGAYRVDFAGRSNAGATAVIYGRANLSGTIDLGFNDPNLGFFIQGAEANDYSGISVAALGDVNADGFDDVIVGAWPADVGSMFEAGEAYIIYGDPNRQGAVDVSTMNAGTGVTIQGAAQDDRLGYSVGAAGDLNGDGVDDFVIGAIHAEAGGLTDAGAAYIYYGNDSGESSPPSTLGAGDADLVIRGAASGDRLGSSVASLGDVNGDGVDDIIVGAFQADSQGGVRDVGRAYVYFGGSSQSGVINAGSLNGQNGFEIIGLSADDWTGLAVANAGDLNADGIDDIIIGAHLAGPDDAGAAYVVFGRADSGFPSTLNLSQLDGSNGFKVTGEGPQAYFGFSVAGAGDVNDDGVDDAIVGSFGIDGNRGASYIIHGRGTRVPNSDTATITVTITGENDAPVAVADQADVIESVGGVTGNVLGNDSDVDQQDTLTIFGIDDGESSSALAGQTLTLSNGTVVVQSDGTFTYTASIAPGSIADGLMDNFFYTVTDGTEFISTRVDLYYVNENDGPIAVNDSASVDQGGSTTIEILSNDSDPDGDPLTVTLVDQTSHLVGFADVVIDFFDSGTGPIAGPYGGDNSNFPISVPVTHVLDGSTVTFISLPTDSSITVAFANERVFDGPGDDIYISESTGSETADVFVSPDGVNFTFLGTATGSEFFDLASIGYTDDVFAIRLVGNDLIGSSPGFDLEFVEALNFEVLNGGAASLNSGDSLDYTAGSAFDFLGAGESATDIFNYIIEDPDGLMDFATVEVTVNGLNDAPVALDDDFEAPFVGGASSSVSGNVLQNDTDTDVTDTLTVIAVNGQAANVGDYLDLQNGEVTINSDGSLTYDYAGGGAQPGAALDSVTYTVSDGTAPSSATVQFTLGQGSAPLTANDDTHTVSASGTEAVGLFDNDDAGSGGSFILVDIDTTGMPLHSRFIIDDSGVLTPDFVDGFASLADGDIGSGTLDYTIANSVVADEDIELGQLTSLGFGSAVSGVALGSAAGQSVAIIGDVNGDGLQDFAVGAPLLTANGEQSAGGVYVVFGDGSGNYAPSGLGSPVVGEGFLISGIDAGALAGSDVAAMGDVNGDGYDDFAVSAPNASVGGRTSNGAVGLVFGSEGFSTLTGFNVDNPNFVAYAFGEQDQGAFGTSIASAGDVNGDGYADAIIGAPDVSANSTTNNGRAYILLGGTPFPGDFLDIANPGAAFVLTVTGPQFDGGLGGAVSTAGDFNGDGLDDFLIGASAEDSTSGANDNVGAAYLVFGASSGPSDLIADDVDGSDGVRFVGGILEGSAGSAVASIGDVNGDGLDDIAITAPGESVGDARIYVVYGRTGGFASGEFDLSSLGPQDGIVIIDSTLTSTTDLDVSAAGDINRDGIDDFIVGTAGSNSQGAALIYGGTLPGTLDLATLDGFSGIRFGGENALDFAGASVSGGGDLNGDGFDDVLIGAPGSVNGSGEGRAYIVEGRPVFVDTVNESSTATVTFTVNGENDAPIAYDDFFDTTDDASVNGDVLINDDEIDVGDTVTVTALNGLDVLGSPVGLSSGALVTLNPNGTFVYDPSGAFSFLGQGEADFDSFTYEITDSIGLLSSATVTIRVVGTGGGSSPTVEAIDDNFTLAFTGNGGTLNADITAFTGNGGTLNADITLNDITPSTPTILSVLGDDLLVDTDFTLRSGATLRVNSDGTIVYSENGAFGFVGVGESILDSFSYTLNDGSGFPGPTVESGVRTDDPNLTGGLSIGNELAGYALRTVGDVNGDGIDDFLIGAPGYYDGAAGGEVGAVYVVFGTGTGLPPSYTLPTLDGTTGFKIVGDDETVGLGMHVDAGDINGDGLDDIIVGGGYDYINGLGQRYGGTVYVMFGRNTPFSATESVSGLNGTNGFSVVTNGGSIDPSSLGDSVATSDMNGDGIEDLILGDAYYRDSASARGQGHVFVLFGSNQGFAASLDATVEVAANRGFVVRPEIGEFIELGHDVDGIGDFNGDGIDDLIAGSPGDGNTYEGMATIIFGDTGNAGAEYFTDGLSAVEGLNITNSGNANSFAGHSVAGIGDFNGDGFDDVAIGIPLQRTRGSGYGNGVVAVVFGSDTLTDDIDISELDGTNGFIIHGDLTGEGLFGVQVEYLGDVDGDGLDDVLILNPGEYRQQSPGVAYVLFGTDQALPANLDTFAFNGINGHAIYYDDEGGNGRLNAVGGGGGDLDADGLPDFLVADTTRSISGNDQSGRIFPVNGFAGGIDADTAQVYIDLSRTGPPPSASSDIWFGSIFADHVDALAGDDTIVGGGGGDSLLGGDGNDVLIGDSNVDVDALLVSLGLHSVSPSAPAGEVLPQEANQPTSSDEDEGQVLNGTDGDDLLLGDSSIDVHGLFTSLGLDQAIVFGVDEAFDETVSPQEVFESDPRFAALGQLMRQHGELSDTTNDALDAGAFNIDWADVEGQLSFAGLF